jgi:hypothetical protein
MYTSTNNQGKLYVKRFDAIIKLDSDHLTIQDQSISMNDDHIPVTNNNLDNDDDDDDQNDNSKKTNNDDDDQIHKTSSTSNVFSRLMHSEPHVLKQKRLLLFMAAIALIFNIPPP